MTNCVAPNKPKIRKNTHTHMNIKHFKERDTSSLTTTKRRGDESSFVFAIIKIN
jgi:hypothetical protein